MALHFANAPVKTNQITKRCGEIIWCSLCRVREKTKILNQALRSACDRHVVRERQLLHFVEQQIPRFGALIELLSFLFVAGFSRSLFFFCERFARYFLGVLFLFPPRFCDGIDSAEHADPEWNSQIPSRCHGKPRGTDATEAFQRTKSHGSLGGKTPALPLHDRERFALRRRVVLLQVTPNCDHLMWCELPAKKFTHRSASRRQRGRRFALCSARLICRVGSPAAPLQ